MTNLKRQSEVLKLLTNPGKILKDLDKLVEKEKSVRALLKDLREGKGKKEALEAVNSLVDKAKAKLSEVTEECEVEVKALAKARKNASDKFGKDSKKLKDMASAASAATQEALLRDEASAKKEEAAKRLDDAARVLYEGAQKTKAEFEGKLKDLNERLKGLG